MGMSAVLKRGMTRDAMVMLVCCSCGIFVFLWGLEFLTCAVGEVAHRLFIRGSWPFFWIRRLRHVATDLRLDCGTVGVLTEVVLLV